jgi:carbonic anhydrase
MENSLDHLLENNKNWAREVVESDPVFFERLTLQQAPEVLWIGCSDSRVPANQITRLLPGEIFVHRNIANVVIHSDINCQAVIQYAVEQLKIKHIVVCGHYGCGGVKAAIENAGSGLLDNWLRHISDALRYHSTAIESITEAEPRFDLCCEKNVIEQVRNVCSSDVVKNAWKSNQSLTVHGWIYSIKDGLIKDLKVSASSLSEES